MAGWLQELSHVIPSFLAERHRWLGPGVQGLFFAIKPPSVRNKDRAIFLIGFLLGVLLHTKVLNQEYSVLCVKNSTSRWLSLGIV